MGGYYRNSMKAKMSALLAVGTALFFSGGCATTPPLPHITYPATYQIPVGNTQVSSNYGPQSLNNAPSQVVSVLPGSKLYYQVVSPVMVVLYIYERPTPDDAAGRRLVGQMEGTTFTSSFIPSTSTVEFGFAVAQANSSGTIAFTLSDRPIAPPPPR